MQPPTPHHATPPRESDCIIVPNRLDLQLVQTLEAELGKERICWLLAQEFMPTREISEYLNNSQASGIIFSMRLYKKSFLKAEIQNKLTSGVRVILLANWANQEGAGGELYKFSPEYFDLLADLEFPLLPLYAEHFYPDGTPDLKVASKKGRWDIQILKPITAGEPAQIALKLAWMRATCQQFKDYTQDHLERPLSSLLFERLTGAYYFELIDGVDESRLNNVELLRLVLPITRYLCKNFKHCTRIGIILPPGKSSIIANIACLIAGISPVNIPFDLPAKAQNSILQQVSLTGFITEERFKQMIPDFNWPPLRDLIYLQNIYGHKGKKRRFFMGAAAIFLKEATFLNLLGAHKRGLDDEAILLFTRGTDGKPLPLPLTHRMLLSQYARLAGRLHLNEDLPVLSTTPLSDATGYMLGFLLPLLEGCSIITYPLPNAMPRIASLAKNYGVQLVLTSPSLLGEFVLSGEQIEEGCFTHTPHFICHGGFLTQSLRDAAEQKLGTKLHTAFKLSEAGGILSLADKTSSPQSAGWVLPGVALRIVEPNNPHRERPLGEAGLLQIKGAGIYGAEEEWMSTGDIAHLSPQAELIYDGRRHRFSQIDNCLVPHEKVEDLLTEYYKLKPSPSKALAVIGIKVQGAERLVLLSAMGIHIHQQDLIPMRYALKHMGAPSEWSPQYAVLIEKIPLRADGQLHYEACVAHVMQQMKR